MNKFVVGIVLLSVILLSGCKEPSMNSQRAGFRSGADVAVTVALDNVPDDKYQAMKDEVHLVAVDIKRFLGDGQISDLPLNQIKQQLYKIVPVQYHTYVDQVIGVVSGVHVNTDKIGEDNLKRMKAACDGIIRGCDEYFAEDRPVKPAPVEKDPVEEDSTR